MQRNVPNSFIRKLIEYSDIVEIISQYLTIKKKGKSYMACCPFHEDNNPSFSVSSEKQIFHCFSCHESGDVIDFLSKFNGLNFIDSIKELANINNINMKYNFNSHKNDDIKKIYVLLDHANKYYHYCLLENLNKQKIINFLNVRNINLNTIKYFQLGYAQNKWQNIYKNFIKKYSLETLKQSGLIIHKDMNTYDHFRDRIIFPIRNYSKGNIIGFGGRILCNSNKTKYLNSPETLLFIKKHELYGLYELKKHNPCPEKIIVVEGYMDVIKLYQHGYTLAVATLGTSMSVTQIRTLFKNTNEIILCFDGDIPGKNATIKSLKIILSFLNKKNKVKILNLPNNHDPDSYIENFGINAFKKRIIESIPALDFFIEYLSYKYKLYSADGLADFFQEIKDYLKYISNFTYKEVVFQKLSKKLDISIIQLKSMCLKKKDNSIFLSKAPQHPLNLFEKALSYIITMPKEVYLALQNNKINTIMNVSSSFTEQHEILFYTLKIIKDNKIQSSAVLIQFLSEKYNKFRKFFYHLLQLPIYLNRNQCIDELRAILDNINLEIYQKKLDCLIYKSKKYRLSENEKKIMQSYLYKKVKK